MTSSHLRNIAILDTSVNGACSYGNIHENLPVYYNVTNDSLFYSQGMDLNPGNVNFTKTMILIS